MTNIMVPYFLYNYGLWQSMVPQMDLRVILVIISGPCSRKTWEAADRESLYYRGLDNSQCHFQVHLGYNRP